VYFAWSAGTLAATFPAQRIDFTRDGIPPSIVETLEQAITCHSTECYIAAAIMVRKTLEMLCEALSIEGKDLKQRLDGLRHKVVISQELLDGLQQLRLLGNDAAHVESKVYEKVGKEEVEVGIEVAKEVLKAVYQHRSIVGRLRALQKPA
jgi:hypothetical protein